jgi:nucleotide-binding universal stress UspA family protein
MSTLAGEKAETKALTIRRIIVALDLTKKCLATLEHAAKFARRYQASLCVAYVFWPPLLSEGERYYLADKQQKEFRQELEQPVNRVRRIVPWCKSAFLVGEPANRIAALARDSHADLIIATSYHRSFLPQLFISDKAIELASRAPCPVLVYQEED